MAEATKLPVKSEGAAAPAPEATSWGSLETLRREIDRAFENFPMNLRALGALPLGRRAFEFELPWPRGAVAGMTPAVDVAEKEKEYEITAELPGMDERNIEIKLSNGTLTIKGEKKEEKEEREKDYYLSERRYGAFTRSFRVPDGVDTAKIEASFTKGVLTVRLPKSVEAQKGEKKIAVKAA